MTGSLTSQLHEGISNYLSISKIWRCWPFPFTGPAKHLLHVKPSWKMKSILYWRRISFINSDRSWVWGLNTTNSCSTERLARASEVHCQNMEKRYGLISIIIPFYRFDESCQSWNFLNALFLLYGFLLCFVCQISEGKSRWVLSPDRYISRLEPDVDQALRSSLADSVLKLGVDHEIDSCLQEANPARLESFTLQLKFR